MTDLNPRDTAVSHTRLETEALDVYAVTQRATADRVAAHAASSRADLTALTSTFGVIGADFLAALSTTMQARASRLEAQAITHGRIGTHTSTAAAAYSDADTACASDMGLRLP